MGGGGALLGAGGVFWVWFRVFFFPLWFEGFTVEA